MHDHSRRRQNVVTIMMTGILLVLISLTIDLFNQGASRPWSHASLGMASVGLVGGIAAFVVSRFD